MAVKLGSIVDYIILVGTDWTIIPHLDWKLDQLMDEGEEITDADLQQAFADGTKYIMEAYGLTEADLNERRK